MYRSLRKLSRQFEKDRKVSDLTKQIEELSSELRKEEFFSGIGKKMIYVKAALNSYGVYPIRLDSPKCVVTNKGENTRFLLIPDPNGFATQMLRAAGFKIDED